jgi:hypothetical protein
MGWVIMSNVYDFQVDARAADVLRVQGAANRLAEQANRIAEQQRAATEAQTKAILALTKAVQARAVPSGWTGEPLHPDALTGPKLPPVDRMADVVKVSFRTRVGLAGAGSGLSRAQSAHDYIERMEAGETGEGRWAAVARGEHQSPPAGLDGSLKVDVWGERDHEANLMMDADYRRALLDAGVESDATHDGAGPTA